MSEPVKQLFPYKEPIYKSHPYFFRWKFSVNFLVAQFNATQIRLSISLEADITSQLFHIFLTK